MKHVEKGAHMQPTNLLFRFREAALTDVPTILHHRKAMFAEMGWGTPEMRDQMTVAFEPWLRDHMARGIYRGFFAVTQGERGAEVIAAGAGLWIMEWPPSVFDRLGQRGYILNVYTEPEYRRLGLARAVTGQCVEACRALGLLVVSLHASDTGRLVYEGMGFKKSNEMRLMLGD